MNRENYSSGKGKQKKLLSFKIEISYLDHDKLILHMKKGTEVGKNHILSVENVSLITF